ncbi:hypothetical protein L7F22_045902 [Adiantum nelumboides]|nr:hypothetical protein [Adiantum nelumboides]
MDLHVLSWNVNGLRFARLTGKRQARVGTELQGVINIPIDILLLQEHELARPFGHLLWAGSRTFWSPANGEHENSCGVCISVSARYVSSIIWHGILIPGRVMYVTLRLEMQSLGSYVFMHRPLRVRGLHFGRACLLTYQWLTQWWTHGFLEGTSTTLS